MKLTTIIAYLHLIPMVVLIAIPIAGARYDHYLLRCGAPSVQLDSANSLFGESWQSDNSLNLSTNFSSTEEASTRTGPNVYEIPFSTARIFTSTFTYSFPVSSGPKFIRLFFYPSGNYSYSTNQILSTADAYLTVQANSDHLLLQNFSAYLTASSDLFVEKEFYVNVTDSRLHLTFFPTPPSTHAFINGIEVVSVPDNLYGPYTVDYVGGASFNLLPTTALEKAYRVNVGGNALSSTEDSGRMYRQWENDVPYLSGPYQGASGMYDNQTAIKYSTMTPNYSAPTQVYWTFRSMGNWSNDFKKSMNLTWDFEVELGFNYLVRLYWCEVVADIKSGNFRVFNVYINRQMADEAMDLVEWVGRYTAVYKDYVVGMFGGDGSQYRGVLQLALHPSTEKDPEYYDTLLNGLEIFKINKSDGSLNAPNPSRRPIATPKNDQTSEKSASHILLAIIGAISGVFILSILLCCLFILQRRKWSKMAAGSTGTNSTKSKRLLSSGKSGTTKRSGGGSSSLPSHLCRYFSLAEIKIATSDFSDSLIIGHGGFGNVYKGTVTSEDGPITVAIKRLNPLSNQGAREFKMEIELLSKLRHLHLVSLIGYCDASGEMILVYEYMSNGTLRDHLYPHNIITNAHLPWLRRLQICVGAARGLHYLHTGTDRMVIHRDVKSTNILLDERWVAKVSDFGLSKLGPAGGDLVSHVSTAVKGSFGYVDPEYYRRQQLTEKSDVYSFGVVLFEVLCGRAAVNPNLPKEQVNLRIWARRNQLTGTLDTIVDPTLMGQISTECLRKFGDVAESCVRDEGVLRPSMADVIGGLELALQLQLEALVPKNINQLLSSTTMTSGAHKGVTNDNTLDEDHHVTTTNISSPTTDDSVRLIRSPGESTWTSVNNSSRLFSSTTSEAYGGSPEVFSQIFKADGR